MTLTIEYTSSNPEYHNNIALSFGFDESSLVWSEHKHVRDELVRLLSFARSTSDFGGKSLAGLDLRGEKPFDLSSAVFEDIDMHNLKLPSGTDFSNAMFIGCNVYGVNFNDCIME